MEGTTQRKIVVAVDEGAESMNALSWSLANLFPSGSDNTLILLYVKPPPPPYSSLDATGYMISGNMMEAVEKYGSELVESVMARAQAVCRKFTSHILVQRVVGRGDAKEVICNTVEKLRADTLVMGSHGYGFFKRALLGSVSEYCAKRARCPVIIVKNHPQMN
ncbi:PREDICTED: universal stress protein A-like protein [Tarenaya hassleriana]|uniref:universal stress protein A-like protein n=1 Tax=Tarenaya hassleriana TaxID=28532 RepID=UPI00053C32CE|nr:PREDICTED: universal stress protein A-like protein [Tarenaya hassleriana]